MRRSQGFDIDAVVRRWDDSPDLAKCGVGFLLYGLLDYVVDTHFEAVQSLDTQIETLEDRLFDENPRDNEMQRRTFELRKSLVVLRRVVLPMREVLNYRNNWNHLSVLCFQIEDAVIAALDFSGDGEK